MQPNRARSVFPAQRHSKIANCASTLRRRPGCGLPLTTALAARRANRHWSARKSQSEGSPKLSAIRLSASLSRGPSSVAIELCFDLPRFACLLKALTGVQHRPGPVRRVLGTPGVSCLQLEGRPSNERSLPSSVRWPATKKSGLATPPNRLHREKVGTPIGVLGCPVPSSYRNRIAR